MRVIFESIYFCYSSHDRFSSVAYGGNESWFDFTDFDVWNKAGVIDSDYAEYFWSDRII